MGWISSGLKIFVESPKSLMSSMCFARSIWVSLADHDERDVVLELECAEVVAAVGEEDSVAVDVEGRLTSEACIHASRLAVCY